MSQEDSVAPPTAPYEGGCTCRQVRYRLASSPLFVNCCHCRWCQRETGSAFVINAMIESDRVSLLQGDIDMVDTPSLSGKGQKIARCQRCRGALWSHYAGFGTAVSFVRVGTLDNPDALPPQVHIFTESKQPWVQLPAGTPVMPQYYKASEIWPAESLERRAALLAKLAPPSA
ncbi:GFA family protein [Variovorax dokdonensis]|uniref:GFA family protein n=1 Tax=Variovorax dokdonensis TaxID=344883 RepID=A0ABT7N4L8_9BURK|nr:GFA family protein [Variovorax dokdonensis]MDM0042872.1 GFA family protein [Variovorax dokdonensis]